MVVSQERIFHQRMFTGTLGEATERSAIFDRDYGPGETIEVLIPGHNPLYLQATEDGVRLPNEIESGITVTVGTDRLQFQAGEFTVWIGQLTYESL